MTSQQCGPDSSPEGRRTHRYRVVYARKMQEQKIFMDDLKEHRIEKQRQVIKKLTDSIGPRWYQVLSQPQRTSLDTLEFSIYQDLLEGLPVRVAKVITILGIHPRPKHDVLLQCCYAGRDDPKKMLAQLYNVYYNTEFSDKQISYCLNAKLMLSAIFYLGYDSLIFLLRERFRPDKPEKPPKLRQKPGPEPAESPYLQTMVAAFYEPSKLRRLVPAPLPDLKELDDEPYEEEPIVPREPSPPPPPPPPPPKKKIPRYVCEKLAGIISILPVSSVAGLGMRELSRTNIVRKPRRSKLCLISRQSAIPQAIKKEIKPKPPTTGTWSAQFQISGVYTINRRTVYVLGGVSTLPISGDLIHGGHKLVNGQYVLIHRGISDRGPELERDPCHCLNRWHKTAMEHLKSSKCSCGHYYDFSERSETATFPGDEVPYFEKPTRNQPMGFNYERIYELNPKALHVGNEFKRIWDTDSALRVDDGTIVDKKVKRKKKKKSSTTCLGENPQPEDYLKCALRFMGRENIAARLPDVFLVPELKEWMRRRIHGPYTRYQRAKLLDSSAVSWSILKSMESKGFAHMSVHPNPRHFGVSTWKYKKELNDEFLQYIKKYKLSLFKLKAYANNLLWASMCQVQIPDKSFRETYFAYVAARVEDLYICHPYVTVEAALRRDTMRKKRYCCELNGK